MPRWEYRCERCGHVITVYEPSLETAEKRSYWCNNPDCKVPADMSGSRMVRVPSAANFTVTGFSSKNGYSK